MTSEVNAVPKQVGITLCTLTFSLYFPLSSTKVAHSTLLLPIPLRIPIVLLLHSLLMSRPSQIARKGEQLPIQKPRPLLLRLFYAMNLGLGIWIWIWLSVFICDGIFYRHYPEINLLVNMSHFEVAKSYTQ